MSDLLVKPSDAREDGTFLVVTPESAGWRYVGFEALRLAPGTRAVRASADREACIVVVEGTATIASSHGTWRDLGGRPDPWAGPPDAAYLPPGTEFTLTGDGEVGICWAPAPAGGGPARVLPGDAITVETRGYGALERMIHPILMGDLEAESLLVCEVLTPAGHWSSFPPHKHDRDALPQESFLEETYYHRVDPDRGFAFQRVYTDDRSLDASMSVGDRECVLVPRGYHAVSAPPGYRLYYLNVMAGPVREWVPVDDPDHAWIRQPSGVPR